MTAWLLLAFLIVAGLLLLFRGDIAFLSDMGTFEIVIVAAGVLLIAVYILMLLSSQRSRPLQAARYLLIWAMIALGLVAAYSYRDELSGVATHVAGELLPPGQTIALETRERRERGARSPPARRTFRRARHRQRPGDDAAWSTPALRPSS